MTDRSEARPHPALAAPDHNTHRQGSAPVSLHIERLVLDNFSATPQDAQHFRLALQSELATLLASGGLTRLGSATSPRLQLPDIRLRRADSLLVLSHKVAWALREGIRT